MRDILDMALEAGFKEHNDMFYVSTINNDCAKELKRFEALVRADEREECAKACEELVPDMSRTANDASVWDVATFDCATAIRARGTHDQR